MSIYKALERNFVELVTSPKVNWSKTISGDIRVGSEEWGPQALSKVYELFRVFLDIPQGAPSGRFKKDHFYGSIYMGPEFEPRLKELGIPIPPPNIFAPPTTPSPAVSVSQAFILAQ